MLVTTASLFGLYSDWSAAMLGWKPNVWPGPPPAGLLIGQDRGLRDREPGPPGTAEYAP